MRQARFSVYQLEVVPAVWMLSQIHRSRIFQQKTTPEILREVLQSFDVRYELQGTFQKRNYCVQYRETDFNFISRLMEEEGIFYFLLHSNGAHTMVIANTGQSHPDCPTKADIPFYTTAEDEGYIATIRMLERHTRLQSGKVTFWDHNFQLPDSKLDAGATSGLTIGNNQHLEVYDYPGGYARVFDGINKGGGEDSGELQKVFEERTKAVKIAMDSLDVERDTIFGSGDCSSMMAGHVFKVSNHQDQGLNGEYVLTRVSHSMMQSPTYISDEAPQKAYDNSFTAIKRGGSVPSFRPRAKTPRPTVLGCQTAVVVGPPGEEIMTDKYGRVKVQFHWDREGKVDDNSSCWVRVAQTWAGNKWGTMFIPRIGMEVIVDFLEGDPDQPIIVGCVYNPKTMPPYTLPDHKTRSTIKTNSSPGGGGFNELRFEDKKGSEQIFIHAEKNMDIRIKNDSFTYVGNKRHTIIKSDDLTEIKGDIHHKASGNQTEDLSGNHSRKVSGSVNQKIGGDLVLECSGTLHLKAATIVIEGTTGVGLKCGGSFVTLNSGGVFIKGGQVHLNSAGSALSGPGASTGSPNAPTEAGDDKPGKKLEPPPPPPSRSGSGGLAMQGAAAGGQPFVTSPAGGAPSSGAARSGAPGAGSGGGGGAGGASNLSPESAALVAETLNEPVTDTEGTTHFPPDQVGPDPSPEQATNQAEQTGEPVTDSEGTVHFPPENVSPGSGSGGGGGSGSGGGGASGAVEPDSGGGTGSGGGDGGTGGNVW
jgi:type VI secretion system secreted protein VgrG